MDNGRLKRCKKCSICGQDFDLKDRLPRLLSCLHAFCTKCLHDRAQSKGNGEITCPTCQKVHKVTGSVSKLPVDPVLERLVEQKLVKAGGPIPCTDDCPDDPPAPAESRCTNCRIYLCQECTKSHKRHKTTRNHENLTLLDLAKRPLSDFGPGHFCSDHPANILSLYCTVCKVACCESCMLKDHGGHSHENTKEAGVRKETDVEPSLNNVKKHITAIKKSKAEAEKHELDLEKNLSFSICDIENMFDRLEKSLKERKVKVLKSFNERSSQLTKAIQKQIQDFEGALAKFEEFTAYYSEVKTNADDVEKIELMPTFKSKFNSMADEAKKVKTTVDKTVVKFQPANEDTMNDLIRSLGRVTDNGVDEHQTRVKGLQHRSTSRSSDVSSVGLAPPLTAVGQIDVYVSTGDITRFSCDVIVSSATTTLTNDCGVALPIAQAAGPSLTEECRKSLQGRHLAVGEVVVTTAGDMPAQHVLHAARPTWNSGKEKKTFLLELSKTILRCLTEACNLRAKSVAFPALATGMPGVPKEECVKVYVHALKVFSDCTTGTSLTQVYFLDIDQQKTKLIVDAFRNVHSTNGSARPEETSVVRTFLKQGNCVGSV